VSRRRGDLLDMGPLPDLIGYHLHRAEIDSYRRFLKGLHGARYTPKQFSVLVLTRANPGASQVDIGKALGMDRATTMLVIDKLHARKLLTRERSTGDRRKQELYLTEKGLALTEKLELHAKTHDAVLTNKLTSRETVTLKKLLLKLRQNPEGKLADT
jgi:DNA-binding MarR family transcriptional regulator